MSASGLRELDSAKPLPAQQTERRCFTVIDGDEMFGLPVQSVQTIFRIEGHGHEHCVDLGPALTNEFVRTYKPTMFDIGFMQLGHCRLIMIRGTKD